MILTASPITASIVVIGTMVGIFILVFLLNKKTPKPEGCEDLQAECDCCPIKTCSNNKSKKED